MFDQIGVTLSAICAVHCLLLPLVVGVLPMIGVAWVSEETELWLSLVAVFVAGLSALWGYHLHKKLRVIALFVGAVGLVVMGLILGDVWYHTGGMFALLGAHILSSSLCKSCSQDCEKQNGS